MRTLYESILDMDDNILDKNGIKSLLSQYGIRTRVSEQGEQVRILL